MKLVICTHGKSAKELLESAEMIAGKQDNVVSLDFTDGCDLEELKSNLKKEILGDNNSVIVMVDLKGGTPFNLAFPFVIEKENCQMITGVNVAMLIEFFLSRTSIESIDQLVDSVIECGKESIDKISNLNQDKENEIFDDGI
ncbi:PTS sugar transporter subunit IIA [Helcococcus kunzii]|uniref:PTS system, mannose/fructose/sorbose family, IIA component n=1 Tax=Helcococcus kunzii ATCC 51366 TaxID=883114 RepID=H3NQL0_9FIRM|nr:PTS sugar transporter subunit IIA [Helcococcus kunzii]EHR32340.1 PTS system, mannose/fructose/sorbose family, IIA component [Helcococcus kunzii ATCC 51366]MCT1796503.1 PTS sugar transporter subunit IIA [Helcococcus kunzii]MCT1988315.1 PTS sugar transporter subunit IIA [Helcococcus kunzii]